MQTDASGERLTGFVRRCVPGLAFTLPSSDAAQASPQSSVPIVASGIQAGTVGTEGVVGAGDESALQGHVGGEDIDASAHTNAGIGDRAGLQPDLEKEGKIAGEVDGGNATVQTKDEAARVLWTTDHVGMKGSGSVAICLVSSLRWFRTFAALLAHVEPMLLPLLAKPLAEQPPQMLKSREGRPASVSDCRYADTGIL